MSCVEKVKFWIWSEKGRKRKFRKLIIKNLNQMKKKPTEDLGIDPILVNIVDIDNNINIFRKCG